MRGAEAMAKMVRKRRVGSSKATCVQVLRIKLN